MHIVTDWQQIPLPPAPKPAGLYRPVVQSGRFLHLSGHAPYALDGSRITGRIGLDLDELAGKEAARYSGLAILSTLCDGGFSPAKLRLLSLRGFVNCVPEFTKIPWVIDGCSQLFHDVLGPKRGVGARTASGANSLSGNIAVMIDAVFEYNEE